MLDDDDDLRRLAPRRRNQIREPFDGLALVDRDHHAQAAEEAALAHGDLTMIGYRARDFSVGASRRADRGSGLRPDLGRGSCRSTTRTTMSRNNLSRAIRTWSIAAAGAARTGVEGFPSSG